MGINTRYQLCKCLEYWIRLSIFKTWPFLLLNFQGHSVARWWGQKFLWQPPRSSRVFKVITESCNKIHSNQPCISDTGKKIFHITKTQRPGRIHVWNYTSKQTEFRLSIAMNIIIYFSLNFWKEGDFVPSCLQQILT